MNSPPWLYSRFADCAFILAPAFLVTFAVEFLFPAGWLAQQKIDPWAWLLLVVGVDVAHVYSTLWRTYFDRAAIEKYRTLLIAIPVACWLAGVMLYTAGPLVFWRALAYIAVFHFVRQQYGFMRLYSRREPKTPWRYLDAAAVYVSTIFPLVYWHTYGRSFHWFIRGDFFAAAAPQLVERIAFWTWAVTLALYFGKEILRGLRDFNVPKNLIVLGTALSWYCGIVRHDGDLAITATNVVAHGVPYMALVWMYQRKQRPAVKWFRTAWLPVFAGSMIAFAYLEEGIWDALVWRDHAGFFRWAAAIPKLEDPEWLAIVVPLLALPQATHYVLDGFIWKVRDTYTYSGGSLGAASRS